MQPSRLNVPADHFVLFAKPLVTERHDAVTCDSTTHPESVYIIIVYKRRNLDTKSHHSV